MTGAAGGIGAAVTRALEADGWSVHAVDVADGDLATREGNRAVVDAALERFGRLDAVVANAGFQHVAPVEEFPEDRWDALIAVLLTSPFLLAKYAWPALAESGDGRFIAIASVHGLVASPFKAGYVAAKHGLLGLVKTLALEGAERGICATAVCPGFVRTPLVEAQLDAQAEAHGLPPERVLDEVLLAPQAVKRLLEPEEVANVGRLPRRARRPCLHRGAGDDGPRLDRPLAHYDSSPWNRSTSPRASRRAGSRPGRRRASTRPAPAPSRETLRDLRAAAERHRRAAHGPRAQRLDPGRADPLAPDARLRHALAAGLRPRGDRDAERGREAAGRREGTSRQELGREAFVERVWEWLDEYRPHDHGPVPPARRLARLLAASASRWTTATSTR